MSILLNSYNQIELLEEVYIAVGKAFKEREKLSEPQLIANLAYFLPKILNNITLANSNVRFEVGSIFIHQKPYVKNLNKKSFWHKEYVELGDVLFINNLVVNDSLEYQRALLLQAKKEPVSLVKRSIPDNKKQLDLYVNWPRFAYRTSNPKLKGAERYIDCNYENDILDGAKYLLINSKNLDCNISDYVARANFPELTNFSSFIIELYNFILGNAGKEFDLKNLSTVDIGWNRIIDDLISNVYYKSLPKIIGDNLRDSGVNKLHRGQGLRLSGRFSKYGCINKDKLAWINDSQKFVDNNAENAEGFSVIEITTLVNDNK